MFPQVDAYNTLCHKLSIEPANAEIELSDFSDFTSLAEKSLAERLLAATKTLQQLMTHNKGKITIDTLFIDSLITNIDDMLSSQIDAITTHRDFESLESLWRSVEYLLNRQSTHQQTLELLTVTKEELVDDLVAASAVKHSILYKHIYIDEYDTPGGEPYAAMVSPLEFDKSKDDIDLLSRLS